MVQRRSEPPACVQNGCSSHFMLWAKRCVTGLVGAVGGARKGQESRAAAHPEPTAGGRGWLRARTHLSRGWAGSGPGRPAFSSAACSRCHGGLRKGRDEDPWIPTAPCGAGQQGQSSPPRDLVTGAGRGKGNIPELFSSPRTSGIPRFRFLSTP